MEKFSELFSMITESSNFEYQRKYFLSSVIMQLDIYFGDVEIIAGKFF